MPRIGLRSGSLLAAAWPLLGALAAALPVLYIAGFTVDDALISVRYARHIAGGEGWRFNPGGPSTDGVTPLPWPLLLAPLARGDALTVLGRAKALGALSWIGAALLLGRAVGRETRAPAWARAAALGAMALSVPLAAHAVTGMETAVATALGTVAVCAARRPWRAAIAAGLAASLRPELGPWACVLAAGVAVVAGRRGASVVGAAMAAVAPFALCAAVRAAIWGRPAPLALLAKPSDLDHGLAYAAAACVVTVIPVLVVAPWALRRAPLALAIVLAAAVHTVAVVAVGGDWMPYARLMVPVLPSLVYAAVLASAEARRWATAVRSVLAVALGVLLLAQGGPAGVNAARRIGADRAALIEAARPQLAGLRRVASLDVGWVGAATEAAVIDLAGVTDPEVAALRGGHTSKRIDAMFLVAREPEALLLYASAGLPDGRLDAWRDAGYSRTVEARLAHDDVIARHFAPSAWIPLGTKGAGYVLLRPASTEEN